MSGFKNSHKIASSQNNDNATSYYYVAIDASKFGISNIHVILCRLNYFTYNLIAIRIKIITFFAMPNDVLLKIPINSPNYLK